MNWAYFHLVINHFPIIGMLIGTMLLLAGVLFKNQGIQISGLGTVVFATLVAIIAYMTGDSAEVAVRNLPDVARSLISRHENIATVSMYVVFPAGLIAALTLFSVWKKEGYFRFLVIMSLVLSFLGSAAMVYTGRTGGHIRHNEFRNDAVKKYIIEHQNDVEED
jgi:uncharacterized membrane protein